MKEINHFLRKNFFVLFLALLVLLVAFLNYKPGTWLAGWDNLQPNLNFGANFERSFFGVWQEYRGLGLLDGMAHTANLVHTFFIFLLSFILPASFLRYLFHFLMWFLGGAGVYFLLKKVRPSRSDPQETLTTVKRSQPEYWDLEGRTLNSTVAFFGALFYILNIGTIQMFYTPLEVFSVHFAVLPWLTYFLIRFLKNGLKRDLVWFFACSLIFTPQSFVPTLFIVYLLSVLLILGFHLRNHASFKKPAIIFALIFAINAFWALPYFYGVFENAGITTSSKINQMANEDIQLKNKAFGDFKSVALIHGFSLNYVDLQGDNKSDYIMKAWREHLQQPSVEVISWVFFGLAILGILRTVGILGKKEKELYPFVVLFIIAFLMLGNDIPIISLPFHLLGRFVPFFTVAFRFVFTKFSLLYVMCYGLFLAMGIGALIKKVKSLGLKEVFLQAGITFLFSSGLIFYSWPVFKGNLFYNSLQVKIPQEYLELIDYFKTQSKNGRLVVLPQPSFWGWTYYNWGFRGSGFIWQGLLQASMDGAFLPWSAGNENFYWQISQAIYSQNLPLLESVLEKYQINWLVLDKNIRGASNYKTLYVEEIEEMFAKSRKISEVRNFGDIRAYKVDLETPVKDFVFLAQDLPYINSYQWNNDDTAFQEYRHYFSSLEKGDKTTKKSAVADLVSLTDSLIDWPDNLERKIAQSKQFVKLLLAKGVDLPGVEPGRRGLSGQSSEPAKPAPEISYQAGDNPVNIFYPFRSLFTGREQEELEFQVDDRRDNFVFSNKISSEVLGLQPKTPDLEGEEAVFWTKELKEEKVATPSVYLKEGKIEVEIDKKKGYFSYDSLDDTLFLKPVKSCDEFNTGEMKRKTVGEDNVELLRFTSLGSSNCLDIDLPHFTQKTGYLVKVESRYVKGKSLLFYIISKTAKKSVIETYLPKETQLVTSYFIIPPTEEHGVGYSLHFDNVSIGRQKTVNDLGRVGVYPIPYRFLKGIKLVSSGLDLASYQDRLENSELGSVFSRRKWEKEKEEKDFQVSHPNPSFYKIQFTPEVSVLSANTTSGVEGGEFDNLTLVLSQSYHPGWTAWVGKPFFGKRLKEHVLINNWANGWRLSDLVTQSLSDSVIYFFFWPQLLEYVGFGLLLGFGAWFYVRLKK